VYKTEPTMILERWCTKQNRQRYWHGHDALALLQIPDYTSMDSSRFQKYVYRNIGVLFSKIRD
jgi:hypothetical protein